MEKLNLVELLKDCPKGMELDCAMYDNVEFDYIEQSPESAYPIHCLMKTNGGYNALVFTHYGCNDRHPNAKCVIFPKGKTTWDGFQRPFKDGDVVAFDNPHRDNLQVFIFKNKKENNTLSSCYLMLDDDELDLEEGMYYVTRFATEEEKQKLFDVIKANGYRWNAETKTLEKLIIPKFKVGDKITNGKCSITIGYIDDNYYYETGKKLIQRVSIENQDDWRLDKFDITTLKPFESRVLVRYNEDNKWCGAFFSHIDKEHHSYCYKYVTTAGKSYPYCIPFEGNKHLLNTTDDCNDFYKTWE